MPRASSAADLVQQPARELLVDPARRRARRFGRRQPQADRQTSHVRKRRLRGGEVLGQRTAREKEDLQRADDPLQIARLNAPADCGVDPPQHRCRRRDAAALGDRLEPASQPLVRPGPGKRPRVSAR